MKRGWRRKEQQEMILGRERDSPRDRAFRKTR